MLKKAIAVSLIVASSLMASPYTPYNSDEVLSAMINNRQADVGKVFRAVEHLWIHAGNYPLNFDNPEDLARAKSDIIELEEIFKYFDESGLFGKQEPDFQKYADLLNSRIYAMQYNMDIAGAPEKADHFYETMILKYPTDHEFFEEYGAYLGSSGRIDKCREVLNKAVELGSTKAHFSLAVSALFLKNIEEAKKEFNLYLKDHPNDVNAKMLLEAISSENVKLPDFTFEGSNVVQEVELNKN